MITIIILNSILLENTNNALCHAKNNNNFMKHARLNNSFLGDQLEVTKLSVENWDLNLLWKNDKEQRERSKK